eukprot:Sdes_comp9547_c0_seq1m1023
MSLDDSETKEFFGKLREEYYKECYSLKKSPSCNTLGEFVQQVYKDFPEACKHFKQACEGFSLGFGKGCFNLGFNHLRGAGVELDPKKAFGYFSKGCELNSTEACNNLAA